MTFSRRLSGLDLLHDPEFNKGTAFTEAERDALGIRGLLPPRVFTLEEQLQRVTENLARKESDLERYVYLAALQDRNETLFYRTIIDHIEQLVPIIYTPTVGEACSQYGLVFRRSRGLYVSSEDRGRVSQLLRNWPAKDIRVIVVTDGERILGLGDLGAHGMGIPIGKLALYTACAGVPPSQCLPVMLDTGTDREELLADPLYIGMQHRRVRGPAYDALVDEFVAAVEEVFPRALIQFEDFATANALALLGRYRNRTASFNDDIQGTAGVVLAALLAAGRLTGTPLSGQRLVFLGAGAAATGIAGLVVQAMVEEGLPVELARDRCWMVDEHGLVTASRTDLPPSRKAFAPQHAPVPDLLSVVQEIHPTALIGVSGHGGGFTQAVVRSMAEAHPRPVILALSNPTSHSECTAEEAYRWSDGRAIYASGSPFDPVTVDRQSYVPAQANNAYIFPGIGLGVVLSAARRVSDAMFAAAARRLAALTTEADLARGTLLPPLREIREISTQVAVAVIQVAQREGTAREDLPPDLEALVRRSMYQPEYSHYV